MKRINQKNRMPKRKQKRKISIITIRDWLGFFLTAAGFWISIMSTQHLEIHFQYSIVIETDTQSLAETE